ncbi:MAG: HAD family phosphatase [Thermodesulfobacteriota bacterium]
MEVVFDLGNVLFEWNPRQLVESLFPSELEQEQALQNIICHRDWQLLDRGTLTLKDAISRAGARCSLGADKIARVYEETAKHLFPIREMFDVVKDLSGRGYRLFVLSNLQRHTYDYLAAAHDIWDCFAGIVISSHVNAIKPEPEIYEYLIDKYEIIPGNAVFLDDIKVNIDAAQGLGLNTIFVQSPSQCRKDLCQMLGI